MQSAHIVPILLLAGLDATSAIHNRPPAWPAPFAGKHPGEAPPEQDEAHKKLPFQGVAKPANAMRPWALSSQKPGANGPAPANAMWPWVPSQKPGTNGPASVGAWPWPAGAKPTMPGAPSQKPGAGGPAAVGAWPWPAAAKPMMPGAPSRKPGANGPAGVGAWQTSPFFGRQSSPSQISDTNGPADAENSAAGQDDAEELDAEAPDAEEPDTEEPDSEEPAAEQGGTPEVPQADDEFHILFNVQEWLGTIPKFSKEDKVAYLEGTDPSDNLCMNNALVPEVFVIGAPKTGTTTFCEGLRYTPSARFPISVNHRVNDSSRPALWKEGHYFDFYAKSGGKVLMHSDFVSVEASGVCPRKSRLFAVDGSARYSVDPAVPPLIAEWYGEHTPRLKFVYMIREPVQRLLSHYHHAYEQHWCMELNMMTFRTVAHRILRGLGHEWVYPETGPKGEKPAKDDPAFAYCRDFVEGSLYTNHLKRYFKYFSPSQFMIIPFKFMSSPGEIGTIYEAPSQFLWKKLGAKGLDVPYLHANKRHHKALDEHLDETDQTELRRWFGERTGPPKIAALLANTDANLWGFKGSPADADSIAAWVRTNW